MSRPAMQFYFGDWKKSAKLRRCSLAARGAWIEILGVLHDQDEYGVVRWPLADLARAAGIPMRYARELVEKGVLKGSDSEHVDYSFTPTHGRVKGPTVKLLESASGACWFSSKLVRDEYIRQNKGSQSRFPRSGANSDPPMGGIGDGIGADIGGGLGDGTYASASSSASKSSCSVGNASARTQVSKARVRTADAGAGQPRAEAVAACAVMEQAGIPRSLMSAEHPFLIAALDEGATPGMFEQPARKAMKRRDVTDPFAFACSAVRGQMADAKRGRRSATAGEDERSGMTGIGALVRRMAGATR